MELENDKWVPTDASVSRRTLVSGLIGAGFALAVSPVEASYVQTSPDGLDAGMKTFKCADNVEMNVYVAHPKGAKKAPVIVIIQEIFGLHEHIQDVCRRFAKLGFYAVAPNLYQRQGDATKDPMSSIMADIVSKVPDAQVMSDVDSLMDWVGKQKQADAKKAGITGFCWGGRVVWLACAHGTRFKAGAAWYGRLDGNRTALTPTQPLDIATKLKAPVLGLYGAKDGGIPLTQIDAMKAVLPKTGISGEFVVYPEAGHGFHADYRPSYRADDAADGVKRLVAHFAKNGVKA